MIEETCDGKLWNFHAGLTHLRGGGEHDERGPLPFVSGRGGYLAHERKIAVISKPNGDTFQTLLRDKTSQARDYMRRATRIKSFQFRYSSIIKYTLLSDLPRICYEYKTEDRCIKLRRGC